MLLLCPLYLYKPYLSTIAFNNSYLLKNQVKWLQKHSQTQSLSSTPISSAIKIFNHLSNKPMVPKVGLSLPRSWHSICEWHSWLRRTEEKNLTPFPQIGQPTSTDTQKVRETLNFPFPRMVMWSRTVSRSIWYLKRQLLCELFLRHILPYTSLWAAILHIIRKKTLLPQ